MFEIETILSESGRLSENLFENWSKCSKMGNECSKMDQNGFKNYEIFQRKNDVSRLIIFWERHNAIY